MRQSATRKRYTFSPPNIFLTLAAWQGDDANALRLTKKKI